MDLRHLRYFVRVAEELHFGRAAAGLGISQPPLSQQIRALEEELGIHLFDRTSRRVHLTDGGALFLIEARRTLDQARYAMDVARRIRLGEEGELAVGFSASVPFVPVVSEALTQFRADYPAIHLTLRELGRDAQLTGLREGKLDLGMVRSFDRPVGDGLTARLLIEEPMLIALPREHPLASLGRALTVADIADQPFVIFSPDTGRGFNEQVALILGRQGYRMRVVQEVDGLGSMLGLVAAALGITVISASLSALTADRVVYRAFSATDAVSRLWLIRGPDLSLAGRSLVRLMGAGDD